MIKEILIFALFAIYQTWSRHYIIETENKAEAGVNYNNAYADDYNYASDDAYMDYQKMTGKGIWLESTRKYIPISRMSPNHVQSGSSPGLIFSKKCTNPFAFFQ